MDGVITPRQALKRDPGVRAIHRAWRDLTGGRSRRIRDHDRRTLVACSGGADSSALALALAGATDQIVIAHVLHDLRPREVSERDADAARELASRLGAEFESERIAIAGDRGNDEANARRARYEALEQLAVRHGCPFVATAHHADDELETVIMGLIRGAGPHGMAGVRRTRPLGGVTLIRPMLGVTRLDAERICALAGWAWQIDETNRDTSRLRAGVRHTVVPTLRSLRPNIARRAAHAASLLRDAAGLVDDRTAEIWARADIGPERVEWPRAVLGAERIIVVGASLRRAIEHLTGGRGLDRMGSRTLAPVIKAVFDGDTSPRRFELSRVTIDIDARRVGVHRSQG